MELTLGIVEKLQLVLYPKPQTSKCGVDDCFKSPSVSTIREASSKVISVNIANKKLKGDASRVASETKD